MLLQIPGVLGVDELARIRAGLAAADWTDGRETVGVQGAQVKRNEQLPDAAPAKAELGRIVLAALDRNPLFFAAALPQRTVPPRFNRYRGGGHYGYHIDGSVMRLGSGDQRLHVRSDISCTLFLNEPADYDGGELVISDTYGDHRVKLAAGDLVIYPSSSLHQITAVTRGERLASFFWVQSMVREDAARRLLFEMDTSIESLRRSGADAAAVLRLTGVYHNLLRRWAEV
jgi:PKHD-type hydroxylase